MKQCRPQDVSAYAFGRREDGDLHVTVKVCGLVVNVEGDTCKQQ
jgi:hypothetical protein